MEEIESIPASDDVSRHLFFPHMLKNSEILWKRVFQFQPENNYCESVVWRKYAQSILDVHVLGSIKVKKDRITRTDRLYLGAFTCSVNLIINLETDSNIQCKIKHDPSENQGRHHAHLKLLLPENMTKPSKNDKSEIRLKLKRIFEPLEECDPDYK